MFTPSLSLAVVFLAIGLFLWLQESTTPAAQQERQRYRAACRAYRLQRRHARRDLQRRYRAVARLYRTASFAQYWQFTGRASLCRTDAALNRYVTLAERYWTTKASSPLARSSVAAPARPGH
jgi:hypothetical protein